jgi:outer membrane lipoprotein carrier protein
MNAHPARALRALLLGLALLALTAQATNAQQAPLTADQVTDKVQGFYTSIADFQSRFEQTYTDVAADEKRTLTGKVFFKKPGKMRWDYLKNDANNKPSLAKVLVSNGNEFTIYEADFDQYSKQCLKDSQLPSALSFLMGSGDLKADFNIQLLPKSPEGTYSLDLTPKQSASQYKKLIFVVDAKDFSVRKTIIHDPYGNTNEISFLAARVNKQLPDEGFQFQPPQGARAVGSAKDLKCQ